MSRLKPLNSSFQAVAVIEKLTESLLKSRKSIKCVETDSETRYVRDAVVLLNQLDIEHPVGQYVVSVCNGFLKQYKLGGDDLLFFISPSSAHPVGQYVVSVCNGFLKQYKTGGNDLIFFICQWTKAASLLCDMGVPTCTIIKQLRLVVDECVEHVDSLKIDIDTLRGGKSGEARNKADASAIGQDIAVKDIEKETGNRPYALLSKPVRKIFSGSSLDKVGNHFSENNTNFLGHNVENKSSCNNGVDKGLDQSSTEDGFIEVILESNTVGNSRKKKDSVVPEEVCLNSAESSNGLFSEQSKVNQTQHLEETLDTRKISTVSDKVHDNSIPVITLKMNNLKQDTTEDDDEFSWFFEEGPANKSTANDQLIETEPSTATGLEKATDSSVKDDGEKQTSEIISSATTTDLNKYTEDSMEGHSKGLKEVMDSLGVIHTDENKDTENENENQSEDNDSDLIRDINDLKKSIETDLEILKNRFRRNGVRKSHGESNSNVIEVVGRKKTDIEDEFDEVWNTIESLNVCDTSKEILASQNECDEFVTVEFSLNRNISDEPFKEEVDMNNGDTRLQIHIECKTETEKVKQYDSKPGPSEERDYNRLKSLDKEVLALDSLLKSFGKDSRVKPTSSTVLNNSRHFRTFQSVSSERGKDSINSSNEKHLYHKIHDVERNNAQRLASISMDHGKESKNDGMSCTKPGEITSKIDCSESPCESNFSESSLLMDHGLSSNGDLNAPKPSVKSVNFGSFISSNKCDTNFSTVSGWNALLDNLVARKHDGLSEANTKIFPNNSSLKPKVSIRSRHFNSDNEEINVTVNDIDNTNPEEIMNLKVKVEDNSKDSQQRSETVNHRLDKTGEQFIKDKEGVAVKDHLKLEQIVKGVLYEADEDIVDVICEAVNRLETHENLSVLNKLVDCYTVSGSKRPPRLVPGLVVKTTVDCATSLQRLDGKPCRVLLINGDISPTYKHKGYKSLNISTTLSVDRYLQHIPRSDRWTKQATTALQKLSIDVILARGRVSDEMLALCDNLEIVALGTVPYRQLKLISDLTETDMGTYIQLVTEDNVCDGIQINQLDDDFLDRNPFNSDGSTEIVLTLPNSNPQTVVLFELTSDLIDLKEQAFWDSLHRVTSCLQTGSLLPGNSQTEQHCLSFLQKRRDDFLQAYNSASMPNQHCLPLVYETMAETFENYIDVFHHQFEHSDWVYDDYSSKTAAWKTACDTVCVILNLEYYITTGLTCENEGKESSVIL